MTTQFQCSVDAHQNRLAIRAALAAVAVSILTNDHCRKDRPFAVVVVRGHGRVVQKRQQVIAMAAKTFQQSGGLFVLPIGADQLIESLLQTLTTRSINFRGQLRLISLQSQAIADQ